MNAVVFWGECGCDWRRLAEGHSQLHQVSASEVSCSGVLICDAGVWGVWDLFEKFVVFQHALVNGTAEENKWFETKNDRNTFVDASKWKMLTVFLLSGFECPLRKLRSVSPFPQSPPSVEQEAVYKTEPRPTTEYNNWVNLLWRRNTDDNVATLVITAEFLFTDCSSERLQMGVL